MTIYVQLLPKDPAYKFCGDMDGRGVAKAIVWAGLPMRGHGWYDDKTLLEEMSYLSRGLEYLLRCIQGWSTLGMLC